MQDCPLNSPLASGSAGRHPRRDGGFTLVELLVVIGIIVVLIGLLLPVVSKIRRSAQGAATKNFVNQLGSAIERYYSDFHAYPGPLANNEMDLFDTGVGSFVPGGYNSFGYPANLPTGAFDISTQSPTLAGLHLTMSENLVLGLLGGLHSDLTSTPANEILDYDPSAVGGGAVSLSAILPKRYSPYMDNMQLSWTVLNPTYGKMGHFHDDSGDANDSIIPCFVDNFSDPLPIIYMRAKVGANPQPADVTANSYSNFFNPIVTNDLSEKSAPTATGFAVRAGQYDISQIVAYTGAYTGTWPSLMIATPPAGTSIGIGKSASRGKYTTPPTGNNLYHGLQMLTWSSGPTVYPQGTPTLASQYPYDAYPYLVGTAGQVREKDGYILISAGPDRVYGTEDDICNFGTVGQ